MIEILYMGGEIARRYVVGPDRYEEPWIDRHRPLAARLMERPDARVTVELRHIPEAPYLEYGASLPLWAEHPELVEHRWLLAYDRPGSASPVYANWLVPGSADDKGFLASGASR